MAENIIIDIQLDKSNINNDLRLTLEQIKQLKAEQKELNKQIKAGNDVDGAMAERLLDVGKQLSYAQAQAKGLSATQRILNNDTKQYSDTLNGQRQKLADMQAAYDAMDATMRESEGGKAFLAQIKAQHEAVLGLEGSTGRMQRNVGNYAESIKSAIPAFSNAEKMAGKFGISVDDLGQGFGVAGGKILGNLKAIGKAFITPPIGIIVMILNTIMKAFNYLSESIKKNDNASTELQTAFAGLKAIANAIGRVMKGVGDVIGDLAVGIANLVTKISGLLSPAFEESARKAADLIIALDNLEEKERQNTMAQADNAKKIAELRAKASESTDVEERKKALEEAIKLEEENAKRNAEIAKEKYELRKEQAKQESDTSDETTNEIARLYAEAVNAETEFFNKKREMAGQIRELNARIAAEEQARAAAYRKRIEEQRKTEEEAEKARQEQIKQSLETEKTLREQLADFRASIIKDEGERELVEMQLQGEREIKELKRQLEEDKNLTAEARESLNALIVEKQTDLDNRLKEKADAIADERINAEMERLRVQSEEKLNLQIELAEGNEEQLTELRLEQLDRQMAMELEQTQLSEENKYLIVEKYEKLKEELMTANAKKQQEQSESLRKTLSANTLKTASIFSQSFGMMSEMLESYGEENEKAKKASKAFALMQLATDQAVSISQTARSVVEAVQGATQAAAATGPLAPVMIAVYIAEMVGLVMGAVAGQVASIVQAKNILSDTEQYATGGIVGGTSYTGDKVPARVNSGEMILNREQQTNLFKMANVAGGFDYSGLASAVADAVGQIPAPVLQYSEFESFSSQVVRMRNASKL